MTMRNDFYQFNYDNLNTHFHDVIFLRKTRHGAIFIPFCVCYYMSEKISERVVEISGKEIYI